jgi:hypothetical protein
MWEHNQITQRQDWTFYQSILIRQRVWNTIKLLGAAVQGFTESIIVITKEPVITTHK